jgi:hypothetical protein
MDLLGNGVSRMMGNCWDGCPRLKSVNEEESMEEKLDDYYL